MDWIVAAQGAAFGLISTGFMSLLESIAWRRWDLRSVLEWHQNQVVASRILRRPADRLVVQGLLLHFLHGAIAGAVFILGLALLGIGTLALALGPAFGLSLWVVTLLIHRPITSVPPWNHPQGRRPALLSLVGHLVYGVVLGLLVWWL